MSQYDDRNAVFNMVMGFMNNVYSSPNSVNFDRILTNSQINPALRADAKKLFEDPLWADWFAKVKTDREVAIRVLETSKLSYKMLLISVHYLATHLLKAYSVERDLKIILDGLQVVLQMITYNPNRIIEQTLCKTTIFRSDEYMMNKFRGNLKTYITAEERRIKIDIILKHYRGQDDYIVLKYMEDFPTVCHTNIPDTYVPIQHTLSYINLTTLLAKIDSLATTTPEIQAMSRELNRHLESFWTSIPLSSYTGP